MFKGNTGITRKPNDEETNHRFISTSNLHRSRLPKSLQRVPMKERFIDACRFLWLMLIIIICSFLEFPSSYFLVLNVKTFSIPGITHYKIEIWKRNLEVWKGIIIVNIWTLGIGNWQDYKITTKKSKENKKIRWKVSEGYNIEL